METKDSKENWFARYKQTIKEIDELNHQIDAKERELKKQELDK